MNIGKLEEALNPYMQLPNVVCVNIMEAIHVNCSPEVLLLLWQLFKLIKKWTVDVSTLLENLFWCGRSYFKLSQRGGRQKWKLFAMALLCQPTSEFVILCWRLLHILKLLAKKTPFLSKILKYRIKRKKIIKMF